MNTQVMKLKIRDCMFSVKDTQQASSVYQYLRDLSGEGGSTWPDGEIVDTDLRISYNGRVWRLGGPCNDSARSVRGREIIPIHDASPVYTPKSDWEIEGMWDVYMNICCDGDGTVIDITDFSPL